MRRADTLARAFCEAITCRAADDDERKRLLLEARGLDEEDFGDWHTRPLEDIAAIFKAGCRKNCSVCLIHADQYELFFNDVKGIPEGNWYLEPFIARYIKALNAIGLNTDWSCDGNHVIEDKKNRMQIGFPERLSMLWHDALCRHHPAFQNGLVWHHDDDKEARHTRMSVCRFNRQNQLETYLAINRTAGRIETQKYALLALKEKLIEKLRFEYINWTDMSDEKIVAMMEEVAQGLDSGEQPRKRPQLLVRLNADDRLTPSK